MYVGTHIDFKQPAEFDAYSHTSLCNDDKKY